MDPVFSQIDHVEKLTNIGIALSAEKNLDNFFKLVLEEAISYTNADAGTIYTVSPDETKLDFQILCTISKKVRLGPADVSRWPSVELYDSEGNKRLQNFVSYVFHSRETLCLEDVYDQDVFDSSGTKQYDKANNYRSKSMLAVPMMNHENRVLGIIQLINAIDNKFEIVKFSDSHILMLQSLASQAGIALSNKKLIEGLENLLHQFIHTIAGAIDRKSKYTGGHISRVAKLTEDIGQAVNNDNRYFSNLFFDKEAMEELSLAGWMHDIGKITTPIYIMDKATKLQTIFDRIELVRVRFELVKNVILKDIACNSDLENKKEKLKKQIQQLETDLQVLEVSNLGTEFMDEQYQSKLKKIAQFRYISGETEYYLINDDEMRNLSIFKGTLLPEEIEKMREHAQVTQEMLSKLTFPQKYKHVPEIASAHHEKLNGKGYPGGLTADKIPIQARIIAVADIFESLTASDRPYKKGKSLMEALTIMAYCVRDGDIDRDIMNLFIDSSLYLKYGKAHLPEEQIDDVDIEKIKAIYKDK